MRETEDELFQKYMRNPHWKRFYENAPSDVCKEHIRLTFVQDALNWDDFVGKTDALEKKFSVADCKYWMENSVGTPYWSVMKKRIEELEGETGR